MPTLNGQKAHLSLTGVGMRTRRTAKPIGLDHSACPPSSAHFFSSNTSRWAWHPANYNGWYNEITPRGVAGGVLERRERQIQESHDGSPRNDRSGRFSSFLWGTS